jgi:GNAT superfamily N-acetyltransferase
VALAHVLARSFFDDPLMMYLLPDDRTRLARIVHLYRAELWSTRRRGRVLTTTDLGGAALWLPPKQWKIPTADVIRQTPWLVRAFGRRMHVAQQVDKEIKAVHPSEPHWFLAILGTDPDRAGTGVGSALIRGITDRLDTTGECAYLESSKERNVPYYERFGFRVTGEVHLTDGPTLWLMWRDPQPAEE